MKRLLILFFIILLIALGFYYFRQNAGSTVRQQQDQLPENNKENGENTSVETVIAQNLDTPWEMVFLPDDGMLVTERKGTVRYINPEGGVSEKIVADIEQASEIGEGGLLGMALHPEFETNNFVYLYYTYSGQGDNTLNRVVRMTYQNQTLSDQEIIVDAIPGASNHNGGRIAFGPDGYLYVTTGDAQAPSLAQDTDSLAGKILRVTADGEPATGNPFNNLVYSYGHRNAQGLAWDESGKLWSTEHGRSGIQSGLDEINLIESGVNYGWPEIQGNETRSDMRSPVLNSGNNDTWAPAGLSILDGTMFFVGLRGSTLYEVNIEGNDLEDVTEHFNGKYGRLRIAKFGPDKMLYIGTSNHDGRGRPQTNDDQIIRINTERL